MLSPPHAPALSSELHQDGGSGEEAEAEAGTGRGVGGGTRSRSGSLGGTDGSEQQSTGHRLLEGGVGLGQGTADTGITNNPTVNPASVWSRAEGRIPDAGHHSVRPKTSRLLPPARLLQHQGRCCRPSCRGSCRSSCRQACCCFLPP